MTSNAIRQRLLEDHTLTLEAAFDKARSLEIAQKHAEAYQSNPVLQPTSGQNVANLQPHLQDDVSECADPSYNAATSEKCMFCGNRRHQRKLCPAKNSICFKCEKRGHFAKMCRSRKSHLNAGSNSSAALCGIKSEPTDDTHSKVNVPMYVNGVKANALIDTGSTLSHLSREFYKRLKVDLQNSDCSIGLAVKGCTSPSLGKSTAEVELNGFTYENVPFIVLNELITDVILGQDFMHKHQNVNIHFGGAMPTLHLGVLQTVKTSTPVHLFERLKVDCRPIATKSRRYSRADAQFISAEVSRLFKEGLIESSTSPWRAQPLVVTQENHKKRMVIDYSQTINKFTLLDAYPLPRMLDVVNKVAGYRIYSTLDLTSAYHQVELPSSDRLYTAFEADGGLWQWKRIPFGLTNAVPCFQRIVDDIIKSKNCQGAFAYLDNITVGGATQAEHDVNLAKFLAVANEHNLTFNESKCVYSTDTIDLLGYRIQNGTLRPDLERIKALQDLPPPKNNKEQQRTVGLFAYYAQWIFQYSDKIKPLLSNNVFPLKGEALSSFNNLKSNLINVSLGVIDEHVSFVVETDASNVAVSATLNQNSRPVAFYSRTLNRSELAQCSVEKEATAVIEAVRKWSHLLTGRRFTLVTDQRSVAFMYDCKSRGKIKNAKILRWRIELSQYNHEIVYRSGKLHAAADTLSRVYCASLTNSVLYDIQAELCHPGVTRMHHFVKSKNLPYSLDEVRKVLNNCRICAEVKPKIFKPVKSHLIKATQPMERLSLDFKGPLPSATKNKYLLTVVDEYSRFPFVFACSNLESKTVISCLMQIFYLFGACSYIHSDRGKSFMSSEFVSHMHSLRIATSRTSVYNPMSNSQCEKYNDIIWTGIKVALKTLNLPISKWEVVLPQVLHSVRSLLYTATNTTPHERFKNFQRRSTFGILTPSWLSSPGTVLVRKHVRGSKYEPVVEEADLIHATPNYAYIRFKNGHEATVSLKDVAPTPNQPPIIDESDVYPTNESNNSETQDSLHVESELVDSEVSNENRRINNRSIEENDDADLPSHDTDNEQLPLRRSNRSRKAPDRLMYYH